MADREEQRRWRRSATLGWEIDDEDDIIVNNTNLVTQSTTSRSPTLSRRGGSPHQENVPFIETRPRSNSRSIVPVRLTKQMKSPSFVGVDAPLIVASPPKMAPSNLITIGSEVEHTKSGKIGVVKYLGKVHVAEGTWVGVELDVPLGKNDGSVDGIRYFDTEENHGCFWKLADLVPFGRAPSSGISTPLRGKGTRSATTPTRAPTRTPHRSPSRPASNSSHTPASITTKRSTEVHAYREYHEDHEPFHAVSPNTEYQSTAIEQYPEERHMDNCTQCNKPIAVRGIEFEEKFYHPSCFRCANCSQIIREMDDFFSKNGLPYCIVCPPDTDIVPDTSTPAVHVCHKCNKAARTVVAFGKLPTYWHPHCFTCTKCGVRINKQVWERDGLPYCLIHKPR